MSQWGVLLLQFDPELLSCSVCGVLCSLVSTWVSCLRQKNLPVGGLARGPAHQGCIPISCPVLAG